MRGYLLRLFGIFFVISAGELLLPDSSLKKYAKVLMSILIFNVMLSPFGVLPDFDIKSEFEESRVEDNFEKEVKAEYQKRIEEHVKEKSGVDCRVELYEDNTIKKVFLSDEISAEVKKYITDELGVVENDIEIGKD